MKNTLYDGYLGIRLPRKVQLERMQTVIRQELTPCQREILLDYYIRRISIPQIAQNRGVNRSTVSRTLKRAEDKLKRFLRY